MNLSLMDLFLVLLGLTEVGVFCLFWFDKAQAVDHGRRVRETNLLQAAVFGGLGAWFAQHLLRHKTRKEPFRTRLGVVIIVHLALIAGVVWLILRYG